MCFEPNLSIWSSHVTRCLAFWILYARSISEWVAKKLSYVNPRPEKWCLIYAKFCITWDSSMAGIPRYHCQQVSQLLCWGRLKRGARAFCIEKGYRCLRIIIHRAAMLLLNRTTNTNYLMLIAHHLRVGEPDKCGVGNFYVVSSWTCCLGENSQHSSWGMRHISSSLWVWLNIRVILLNNI